LCFVLRVLYWIALIEDV